MSEIYNDLRAAFPTLERVINEREARGLETYDGRPLRPTLKASWIPDLREELGDCLVYLTSEILLSTPDKRVSATALHKVLALRGMRERIARMLRELAELEQKGLLES